MTWLVAALLLLGTMPGTGTGGEELTVAGSGTLAPYVLVAAGDRPVTMIEIGTEEGLRALCREDGMGADLAAASRRIRPSEVAACRKAGIGTLIETVVGLDGIVLAQSAKASALALAPRDLYLALAEKVPAGPHDCRMIRNPAKTWRDVRADLPDRRIEVYGPPPGSGTRAMFERLAVKEGAFAVPCAAAHAEVDPAAFERTLRIRKDGAWIDGGESDGALAYAVTRLDGALGVFGLVHAKRQEGLTLLPLGGVAPTREHIRSGRYRLGRPLFLYTNAEKLAAEPGLGALWRAFGPDTAQSEGRLLLRMGLVELPGDNRAAKIDTATGERRPAARILPSGD